MVPLAKIQLGLVILVCFIVYRLKTLWQKYYFGYRRPEIQLAAGKVRGLTEKLPNGEAYHFFKGIPYAKPPIGKLRFQPPVPIQKYESTVIDCSVHRNEFIQLNFLTNVVLGSEDGLYLNVYTPELPDRMNLMPNLPVMIFLYGGGFQEGSGDSFIYNPVDLVQSGVIVVTFNYRLGPFGFLCLPRAGIYGNMGLKDQRLVFQWVQQNITRFGGNPNNVTLFGVSAGTISAQIHYISDNSKHLFHRVIGQSCTGFTLPYLQNEPVTKSRKLARLVKGSDISSDEDALDILMRAPARRLVKLQTEVGSEEEQYGTYKFYFRACVEPVASEGSVLIETPETILKRYDTFDMPMITGGGDCEGGLSVYLLLDRLKYINAKPERYLISSLVRDADIADRNDLTAAIKKFYFGDKNIGRNSLRELCDLMTDVDFAAHQMVAVEWISKYQPRVRHFFYRFAFAGRYGIMNRVLGLSNIGGTWHGDDAFYIFKPWFIPQLSKHSEEEKVKDTFIQLWTSFAKYGEPVLDDSKECEWIPVKACGDDKDVFQLDCLNIDVKSKMVYNPCQRRVEFWRGVLKKYKKGFL